jgi:carbonic anhydrase
VRNRCAGGASADHGMRSVRLPGRFVCRTITAAHPATPFLSALPSLAARTNLCAVDSAFVSLAGHTLDRSRIGPADVHRCASGQAAPGENHEHTNAEIIQAMDKIIQGVRNFQSTVFEDQRSLFEMLGQKQQTPIALFITCSDSRINPNLITSTEPGDLFLLRNAGNIVPPYGAANGGEGATIEYAVSVLNMRNIIVCGHYHCGAMHYLMRMDKMGELPAVRSWFAHAEATRRIIKEKYKHLSLEAQESLAIEQNVLVQIANLRTHPCVAAAIANDELHVYGWVYRIETGEVKAYDPTVGRFLPLGEMLTGAFHVHPHNGCPPMTCDMVPR